MCVVTCVLHVEYNILRPTECTCTQRKFQPQQKILITSCTSQPRKVVPLASRYKTLQVRRQFAAHSIYCPSGICRKFSVEIKQQVFWHLPYNVFFFFVIYLLFRSLKFVSGVEAVALRKHSFRK